VADDSLWWVPIAVAVAGGGLLAAVAAWAGVPGTIYRDLTEQLEKQRAARREAEHLCETLRSQLVAGAAEIEQLRKREGRLFRSVSLLMEANGIGEAFDHASDGIVFATADGGGAWVWVNQCFAAHLGMDREEVVAAGWRALIHPDDMAAAREAEGSAWDSPVLEFVARYRRAPDVGGGWIRLRWYCPGYRDGRTVCVVKFGRIEGADA
jgi:PAS domain-containing protein